MTNTTFKIWLFPAVNLTGTPTVEERWLPSLRVAIEPNLVTNGEIDWVAVDQWAAMVKDDPLFLVDIETMGKQKDVMESMTDLVELTKLVERVKELAPDTKVAVYDMPMTEYWVPNVRKENPDTELYRTQELAWLAKRRRAEVTGLVKAQDVLFPPLYSPYDPNGSQLIIDRWYVMAQDNITKSLDYGKPVIPLIGVVHDDTGQFDDDFGTKLSWLSTRVDGVIVWVGQPPNGATAWDPEWDFLQQLRALVRDSGIYSNSAL